MVLVVISSSGFVVRRFSGGASSRYPGGVVFACGSCRLLGGSFPALIGDQVTSLCDLSVPSGVVASRFLLRRGLVCAGVFCYHGGESPVISCMCLRVRASAFLMELALCVMDCLSLFGTGDGLEQSRVFLFGSRGLQVCGDPRGAAFPLYAGLKASGRGFGGAYNPLSAWIALLLKSIR
ncbi:hypothetical protein F2Q69_00049065 [Brassica cretica]|uniref:Uncharacterized protein n=1 Tax=Brassica cretica TaxID=69181 RepID=A0A8S9PP16_BRACR|nr:hypothetical protein F2Q69_00049065 [Brassica cretica]